MNFFFIIMEFQLQQILIGKNKIFMNQKSVNSMSSPQKTNKIEYFYPSERQSSCCGKGPFKSRFPIQLQLEKTSFCTKMCAFFCFFLSYDKRNIPKDEQELQRLLPIKTPIFSSREDKITYTWIGHSTAVISIGKDANIIIDPVFSRRASPVQWAGPQRYRKIPCNIGDLPQIHAAFVSHDHYDHLDEHSLNQLEELFSPVFVAGLDSKDSFPKNSKLIQLDWTETKSVIINGQQFQVTFFPVCHWSKRGLFEKNTRLWGGFVIKTPKGKKIFYPGDTAYCQIFQEIGERFGPFDLAVIPIGAYQPRHLLSFSHINPEQAVIIHKQIRSKKSIGVHWGTFPLGFQHYYKPKQDLEEAITKHGLSKDEFITMHHGDEVLIDY